MINNKKNIVLIKKIILLLILIFFSNLFYLYFKTNNKETFTYPNNYKLNQYSKNSAVIAKDFLNASYDNDYEKLANDKEINSLTESSFYVLGKPNYENKNSKNFILDMGIPNKFPINDIAMKGTSDMSYSIDDIRTLAFGYGNTLADSVSTPPSDVRKDADTIIYLDNYDQIDKIIEREKLNNNYAEDQIAEQEIVEEHYKLRDVNDESLLNRRGTVEVAYSRKKELNETKNKYDLVNRKYNSINLQYIFLIVIIIISVIVLGLYYLSLISNTILITYILLLIFVIYFFNITNIIF